MLDAPVSQMVDQLPDIEQLFRALSPDPEQVIEVLKIVPYDVPVRTAVRDSQLAERLVEVLKTMSFFPRCSGLRNSTSTFQFLVVEADTLHVSQERISERIMEQIVDFPVPVGGLQDFRPGQSSSSSSHVPAGVHEDLGEPGEGVFRTFPRGKKSVAARPSARVPRHVSSWTPAVYGETVGSDEWVQFSR